MHSSVQLIVLLPFMLANTVPDQNSDDIIVNAPAREAHTLKQQASDFIRQISDTADQEQFSRRNDPFCIKIIGIDQAYHGLVFEKIRETAKETKAQKEAQKGCRPNIFIIFSENADGLTEIIKRRKPSIFNGRPKRKLDELFQSKKPVRWWYGITLKGSGSEPIIDGAIYRTNSSLISSGIEIEIASTVIIVDINQSHGYPLESVSSFISMITFSQINSSNHNIHRNSSILGIFNDTKPRINALRHLTVWDRAYLHALYSIPADRPLWQQRSRLRGAMIDYIQKNGQLD